MSKEFNEYLAIKNLDLEYVVKELNYVNDKSVNDFKNLLIHLMKNNKKREKSLFGYNLFNLTPKGKMVKNTYYSINLLNLSISKYVNNKDGGQSYQLLANLNGLNYKG